MQKSLSDRPATTLRSVAPKKRQTESFRDTSRSEYVYRQLRDGIQGGRFPSGYRLREEEIADLLKVSRTPVRDGLRRLQSHGLAELAPGRGLIVVTLDRLKLAELYAMSELLDGGAARWAAQHASASDIATLRHLQSEFRVNMDKPAELAKINRMFHQCIADATRNRYLLWSMADHADALAVLPDNTHAVPGRPQSAYKEHEAIVTAIAGHNPDAAEEAARAHIRSTQLVRMRALTLDNEHNA
jgi:DNA-binding GntR family transcriptional regulator